VFNLGYTPEVAEIGWAGLPPAILKHAGGMFHPPISACGSAVGRGGDGSSAGAGAEIV
jgi:hypothetical protein